jgi:hypothetical protein
MPGVAVSPSDIWGTGAGDIWAVASTGVSHFDGANWSTTIDQTAASHYGAFGRVWGNSSSDVFIVAPDGVIMHYQGSGWSSLTAIPTFPIYDIAAYSTTAACGVGGNGLAIQYDGTTWTTMESATNNDLYSVCGWGDGRYMAVGASGALSYYDGSQWTNVNSGTTETLHDIWCTTPGNSLVVGSNATILACTSSGCTPESKSGVTGTLYSVHQSDLGLYAGGQSGQLFKKNISNVQCSGSFAILTVQECFACGIKKISLNLI